MDLRDMGIQTIASRKIKGSQSIMKETIALIKPVLFHKALANTTTKKKIIANKKEYTIAIC
jgi:hypothetical protein